ncbi:MAG: AraC family transcriptional regulator [Lachnospiraceae bacterium]|nr:AraC family transcriptional regulator [Lachnospiraceae bacterium]
MRSKEAKVCPASDYYVYVPSAVASKIYLYPVALGYFYYEPGYYLHRNSYDSILLMHIRSGKCILKINGKDCTAARDQIVLLDCYRPHEYGNGGSGILEISWIHFDGPLAREYYDIITSAYGNIMSPENLYPIAHNMDKILNLFRSSSPVREASVSGCLTQILTELLTMRSEQNSSSSRAKIVENSIAYINEHFSEPLTLESIAQNSNLSPYHFTRVFTAETGFTPHQYLIATRLNSAKFLLRTPGMSIKEIAFNSGFNSESSFCTTFRKWEHMTPSEYRCHSDASAD